MGSSSIILKDSVPEIRQGCVNYHMDSENRHPAQEIAIIRAEESGVTIFPLPWEGGEPLSPIRLDAGELFIMLINDHVRGYKLRGKVELLTRLGRIEGRSKLIVQGGTIENC